MGKYGNVLEWIAWLCHPMTIFYTLMILTLIYALIYGKEGFKNFGISEENKKLLQQSLLIKPPKPKHINHREEECRRIFEKLFGVPFTSIRPDWLLNSEKCDAQGRIIGRNLELDGFNPDIITPKGKGLAFEHQGRQHYEYTPYFHRHGRYEIEDQIKRDIFKKRKCIERGIVLIDIPESIPWHDLRRYIIGKLNFNKIDIDQRDNFKDPVERRNIYE